MINELVLIDNKQKTFLDELILIFLRMIKLTWYNDTEGNLNFAIFHLHYFLQDSDEVKKLVKQKYVNDFIKEAYEQKEQEYRLVIKTLLLLKKIYDQNITLFYSEHGFPSIEIPGIENENSNNPLMTNTLALEAAIKKASEILNKYTLEDMAALGNSGDLLGRLSLDSSVIAPIPHFIPKDIKNNINLFTALSSKYQLQVFLSKPSTQSLSVFFEDYLNGFISQDLSGIAGINNLKIHLALFEKVITEVLGEGKQTKWAEILLSKSLIAYYATLMDKSEYRDYLQYRMIEFLLYLENNSKIEILFLDKFDKMNVIRYEITSMPKNALKIDGVDWVAKIKLLHRIEDILSDFQGTKLSHESLEMDIDKKTLVFKSKPPKLIDINIQPYIFLKVLLQKRNPSIEDFTIELYGELSEQNIKQTKKRLPRIKDELKKKLEDDGFEPTDINQIIDMIEPKEENGYRLKSNS